jgi:hypothetical protein
MSSIVGRAAFRATRPLYFRTTRPRFDATATASADNVAGKDALKKGAKRDPELYVRLSMLHMGTAAAD